jgi:hypothetical protein
LIDGTGTTRVPRAIKALLGTEILSAIAGFVGGVPLTLDPSGKLLGMPLDNLKGLPIHDFLLPGLWLFFVFGVGLSATTYGLWKRVSWGRPLGLVLGIVWIGWVFFELYLWGFVAFVAVWLIFPVISIYLLIRKDTKEYLAVR